LAGNDAAFRRSIAERFHGVRADQNPGENRVGLIDLKLVTLHPEAIVNQVAKIEISVDSETARALADPRRLEAVGRLIDRMVRPSAKNDPLAAVLEATAADAREQGLTDDDIDTELAAYNAERRQG
jgi:hypothetical protein